MPTSNASHSNSNSHGLLRMAAVFMPNGSGVTFTGNLSVATTTLTILRTPFFEGGEPLFVGICTIPAIQFCRHKNVLLLLRDSTFLFDSVGLVSGLGGDVSMDKSSVIDSPRKWKTLVIQMDSLESCESIVQALCEREARETQMPPFSIEALTWPAVAAPISRRASSCRTDRNKDSRVLKCATPSSTSPSADHQTVISVVLDSEKFSDQPRRSSRKGSESRCQGSSVGNGIQSTVAGIPTPNITSDPVANSQDSLRVAQPLIPRCLSHQYSPTLEKEKLLASSGDPRCITSYRTGPCSTRSVNAMERELKTEPRSAAAAVPCQRRRQTPSSCSSHGHVRRHPSPIRKPRPLGELGVMPQELNALHSPYSIRSSVRRSRAGSRILDDYSDSAIQLSVIMKHSTSTEEHFFRAVYRLQHHRLHFMQHLHKEMVHQAYLVEKAKLRAGADAFGNYRASEDHHERPPGFMLDSIFSDEAVCLKKIEARLAEVEKLHREAEREREAAARLRREYECLVDELNTRNANHIISVNTSELNRPSLSMRRADSRGGYCNDSLLVPNGQMVVAHIGDEAGAYPLAVPLAGEGAMLYEASQSAEPRYSTMFIDRHVFGEEWAKLYPEHDTDIRFNAQIDICLLLKLPCRQVTVTHLSVDRQGLRMVIEIRHDQNKLSQSQVERRVYGCPFHFLHRLYSARDSLNFFKRNPTHATSAAAAAAPIHVPIQTNGRRSSRSISGLDSQSRLDPKSAACRPPSNSRGRMSSRPASAIPSPFHRRHRSSVNDIAKYVDDDIMSSSEMDDFIDADTRRQWLLRRVEDRVWEAQQRMERRKRRMRAEMSRQMREYVGQLIEEESYVRGSLALDEAKQRKAISANTNRDASVSLRTSLTNLTQNEAIERATAEVAAARQMQVLMGAHRRQLMLHQLMHSESYRRRAIAEQEAIEKHDLDEVMNPGVLHSRAVQMIHAEKLRRKQIRGAETRMRRLLLVNLKIFLQGIRMEAIGQLIAKEEAARAAVMTEAVREWPGLLCEAPARGPHGAAHLASAHSGGFLQLLQTLVANETASRALILADQTRHCYLYKREDVIQREITDRDCINLAELDTRNAILDAMVLQNRQLLQRRINERERVVNFVYEEQFYRKALLADEQDAFEVINEFYATDFKTLLTQMAERSSMDELTPRRLRVINPRRAKPFHYMTFTPEDMNYPPSAELAIQGILGCVINKNLEVASVSRSLHKTKDDDQLQAGDMILDAAGYSLHSLSHLREILSARCMQIQEEARQEFSDVPEDQFTLDLALQKYIELLCIHHNFLVQVLRGCDIYQIIVRS